MTTAAALGLQVATRINDPAQSELSAASYLTFLNMALDDLNLAGWLQRQTEDTSITLVDGTYEYLVPDNFAYVSHLYVADVDGNWPATNEVPQHQWYIGADSPTAKIHFYPDFFDQLIGGRVLKITGQARFAGSLGGSETLVPGSEAFVRERAASYAAEALAAGSDEQAQRRGHLADQTWAKSQAMLGNHPMEFRVLPNAILVPGPGTGGLPSGTPLVNLHGPAGVWQPVYPEPFLPTRLNIYEGSDINPIQAAGTGFFPGVPPMVLISRTILSGATSDIDWSPFVVQVKSLAGGGQSQASAAQFFVEQYNTYDAMTVGTRIIHYGIRGGLYGYFAEGAIIAHVCTFTNGNPTTVTIPAHNLHVDDELHFQSDGGSVPTGIVPATAGGRYFVASVGVNAVLISPQTTYGSPQIQSVGTGATPTVTTVANHGLSTGGVVLIIGSNCIPSIDSSYSITVTGAKTFTVTPASPVTVAGTAAGYAQFLAATTSTGSGTIHLSGNQISCLNPLMVNGSHTDFVYTASGANFLTNICLQNICAPGDTGYVSGMGMWFVQGNQQWSEGIVADALTIKNKFLMDNSSAVISYYIGGAHMYGIDMSPGTFSGAQIRLTANGFTLGNAGGANVLGFESGYGLVHDTGNHHTQFFAAGAVRGYFDNAWVPTANQTFLHLYEGVGPTDRQVGWKDGAFIGGGDKVMVMLP